MDTNWSIDNVQVQTISWCNRCCPFCPSQKIPRTRELMTLETYQCVLRELASIGFSVRFSPYLMGEPLLDKRIPDLIGMASHMLPKAKLLLQTNGDALTIEKGLAIFKGGLHKLVINCYDGRDKHVEKMRDIGRQLAERIPGCRFIKADFHWMIRPERPDHITREIVVEDKTRWTKDGQDNWAGNVPGIEIPKEPLRRSCFRPFRQLFVHYNGNVVLCCCDWQGEVVFGNLRESSLVELYEGPTAREYRTKLAQKNRRIKLCEVCDFRGNHPLGWRLTWHALALLNRVLEQR